MIWLCMWKSTMPVNYAALFSGDTKICNNRYWIRNAPPFPPEVVWTFIHFLGHRSPLPIIDALFLTVLFMNHKNEACHVNFNPSKVKSVIPHANLVVAEQTFAWLSKFKKTLNSMPKRHQLFLLHRLVKCRNSYTQHWYKGCLLSFMLHL